MAGSTTLGYQTDKALFFAWQQSSKIVSTETALDRITNLTDWYLASRKRVWARYEE